MSAPAIDAARAAFRARLLVDRILIDGGSLGLYGRGPAFVQVFDAVDRVVVRNFGHLRSEIVRFPPLEAAAALARTAPAEAPAIAEDAGLALPPTVCHPLFPSLRDATVDEAVFDLLGNAFGAEPSVDPLRMRSFHQHEFVYVGTPDGARNHRDANIPIVADLLRSLGLEIAVVPARDAFFGAPGDALLRERLTDEPEFEFVTPVYGPDQAPTAITSANLHADLFGRAFGIRTPDGATAHSSCVGFGLERITIALFGAHGSVPARWPFAVREVLGI